MNNAQRDIRRKKRVLTVEAHQRPVARARGRPPHRWRTPSRTPPRGTAPCATARLWRSRRPAATPAQGAEAMGDQANGGGDGGANPGGLRSRAHGSRRRMVQQSGRGELSESPRPGRLLAEGA